MGMQIPCGVYSEVPEEDTVQGNTATYGGNIPKGCGYKKESHVLEGYLQLDHVHMLISIPPKYPGRMFRETMVGCCEKPWPNA